ncbi:universal stress protein [Aliiglaciecola sp. CAU 1673]|uniref:universal stress protein n=1 Tax=Aliiglaciecola sp. CAU 1673 TaxID=3032595 RepID=UPI0023DC3B07|nr:universal stress protein [Aliiglaciecola sp. CAU 1673]MDF2179311.1 universal stress protein [Aliiglaciecola sp. CAU 1673]
MNKLLVIADLPKNKAKALAKARMLATGFDSQVHVVSFVYEQLKHISGLSTQQMTAIKDSLIAKRSDWLKKELENAGLTGANVTCEVVWEKNIAGWVTSHSQSSAYDLIIKTGHRSEGLFYTPTDWHLLRTCQVPVLLVADKKWKKQQNTLVALDLGSKLKTKQALNKQLLQTAVAWSNAFGGELHVVYCQPMSSLLKDIVGISAKEAASKAKREVMPLIEELRGDYPLSKGQIHIKAGEPEKVIPSVAADVNAGVVIIGTVGRKGLRGQLLGNTAEKVLSLLKTDALAIQP